MAQDKATTMRSLAIEKYCKPDEYKILDLPIPKISAPDELLIKVHAASINPIDVKVADGQAKLAFPASFPHKLGYDVSGTVIAVGSAVPSHLQPGAEVYTRIPQRSTGAASEYVFSTVDATAPKPSTLSHIEAASIPLASLTSLQSLDVAQKHFEGGLKGKTVLIPGGLSATGSCAVQVAKNIFGAGNVITTLSPSKAAKIDTLLGKGVVDRVIDYTKEDMSTVIERGSVDFMFDTMGQALASLHLMKPGGLIVSVSSLPFGKELKTVTPDMPALVRCILNGIGVVSQWRARRYGVTYLSMFMHPSAEDLGRLGKWADEGSVKPVVGRVARLDNLQEVREGCQEILNAKGGTGKFVIEIV